MSAVDRSHVETLQRRVARGDLTAIIELARDYPLYVRDPGECAAFYARAEHAQNVAAEKRGA